MKRLVLAVFAVCATASLLAAHDFWLVPVGEAIHGISSSTFPRSDNAVAPARLAQAVAVTPSERRPLEIVGAAVNTQGDSVLVLKADPSLRGTFWAAVAIKPRRIDLPADAFNEYLLHDGLPQIYERRRERGELGTPAVERYQKYAKALITRPGAGSAALQPVGHRIEIVPLGDPSRLRPGDTLRAAVRFDGHGVRGLTVHAGFEGQPGGAHAQTHQSDTDGAVAVPVTRGGLWYLRTIHMLERDEPPFQWESFWASLTFRVP